MMKGCCMLTSCFKKKPLLDDQYGDIQEGHIKYLEMKFVLRTKSMI